MRNDLLSPVSSKLLVHPNLEALLSATATCHIFAAVREVPHSLIRCGTDNCVQDLQEIDMMVYDYPHHQIKIALREYA